MVAFAAPAWAEPSCKALCEDTIKACKQQCEQVLKKSSGAKIAHCQQKCGEFKKECERDCDNKKK